MRWAVMVVFALVAGASALLLGSLKSELAPVEDRGFVIGIFSGPEGATIDYMDRYARQLEAIYAKTPDVERYFCGVGQPHRVAGHLIRRPARLERTQHALHRDCQEAAARILRRARGPGLPGHPALARSGARSRPVNFVVVTSASYHELQTYTDQLMAAIADNPGFVAADSDLKLTKPELAVAIDRDKAADLGLSVGWSVERSRPCWADVRSRASSRTPSSTT